MTVLFASLRNFEATRLGPFADEMRVRDRRSSRAAPPTRALPPSGTVQALAARARSVHAAGNCRAENISSHK